MWVWGVWKGGETFRDETNERSEATQNAFFVFVSPAGAPPFPMSFISSAAGPDRGGGRASTTTTITAAPSFRALVMGSGPAAMGLADVRARATELRRTLDELAQVLAFRPEALTW